MVKKVVWTRQAVKDKNTILTYWIERNLSNRYSLKLDRLFDNTIRLISEYPNSGKPTNKLNVRVRIVRDYLIIYEVREDFLYILTIWDSRRNPEKLNL